MYFKPKPTIKLAKGIADWQSKLAASKTYCSKANQPNRRCNQPGGATKPAVQPNQRCNQTSGATRLCNQT
jgi:hypothetical protein